MEQTAERPPAEGPMADVGSLARVALPEILTRIALNELSGTFKATSGKTVRTIYFDRGFVVFTASTSNQDRLGQCLLRAGKVTEHELEIAMRLMKTRNRRIGQAIVAAGVLTEDEIGRELAEQTRRVATAIYAQKGMYRFEQQECPIPMELRLSLSMYRLQLEGIRKITNRKLIVQSLPPLDEAVRLSKCPTFSFQDVHFVPIELLVMEAAQEERELRTIVTRVGLRRSEVLRAIYGLLRAGILERLAPEQPAVPLKVQEETGFFLLSTLGDDDDTEVEDVRQEVLLEYESSEHASAEKLLDIEASASKEEIRRAFAMKQVRWSKTQKELDNDSTLCVKVDEIKQRLERAKAAMLEPKRTQTPVEPKKSSPKPAGDKDEIQRLMREIKLRKTKNDVEGVISLLYEIVQLEPENAKYEALLARTLASHGAMKKKAERHYRRAVSLDPQNAELHYDLGRYYQSFDMNLRAIAELKTALQINPKFSEARSALVELQGGDTFLEDRLEKLLA